MRAKRTDRTLHPSRKGARCSVPDITDPLHELQQKYDDHLQEKLQQVLTLYAGVYEALNTEPPLSDIKDMLQRIKRGESVNYDNIDETTRALLQQHGTASNALKKIKARRGPRKVNEIHRLFISDLANLYRTYVSTPTTTYHGDFQIFVEACFRATINNNKEYVNLHKLILQVLPR